MAMSNEHVNSTYVVVQKHKIIHNYVWVQYNTVCPCDQSHAKYWSHDLLGRKYSPVIYLSAPSSGGYRWGGEEKGSSLTAWSCNPVSEEDNTNGQ